MFETEIDIKLIVSTATALLVLSSTLLGMIGFSIKKLIHFMKG